jgi:hypothetical protein
MESVHEPIQIDFTPKLNQALAKAQFLFDVPVKNRRVEVYSKPPERKFLYEFWYADLVSITAATKKGLSENGLSFVHLVERENVSGSSNTYFLATYLRHESGEYLKSILPLDVKQTEKEVGASITYSKRYNLSGLLGVSADDDTDGNYDEDQRPEFSEKKPAPAKLLTPLEQLLSLVKSKKIKNEDMPEIIYRNIGRHALAKDLDLEEVEAVISYLKLK